jgi:hypothetical protein
MLKANGSTRQGSAEFTAYSGQEERHYCLSAAIGFGGVQA